MKGTPWACMVLVLLVSWNARMSSAAVSSAACKEERRIGINTCKSILYGKPPSPQCCQRIRVTHVECVCPVITPKLAALIDVNRFIKLIEGCGRRFPRHFKCGSITIP